MLFDKLRYVGFVSSDVGLGWGEHDDDVTERNDSCYFIHSSSLSRWKSALVDFEVSVHLLPYIPTTSGLRCPGKVAHAYHPHAHAAGGSGGEWCSDDTLPYTRRVGHACPIPYLFVYVCHPYHSGTLPDCYLTPHTSLPVAYLPHHAVSMDHTSIWC